MKRSALVLRLTPTLDASAAAQAAGPQHFQFTFGDQFLDTTSCSFPISGSFTVTNDVAEWDDANGVPTRLQLHQTFAATLVGNGVTLVENDHEQTFVAFVDGTATQAIHVGTIFHLTGPSGRLTLNQGRAPRVATQPIERSTCDDETVPVHGRRRHVAGRGGGRVVLAGFEGR